MKEFFLKILTNLKSISTWILAVLLIGVVITLFALAWHYLKQSGRTVTIYPKFKVVKIEDKESVNRNALKEGIDIGEQILKKLKVK